MASWCDIPNMLTEMCCSLAEISVSLRRLADHFAPYNPPTQGIILLTETRDMAKQKMKMVAVPTFDLTELATKGALIQLFDAGDNPTPLPTTPHTHTWTTDDASVLTVTPDATNPDQATVASTGKVGKTAVHCLVHATDTPPSFPDIDAQCIVNVPAGPPTQGTIALAP